MTQTVRLWFACYQVVCHRNPPRFRSVSHFHPAVSADSAGTGGRLSGRAWRSIATARRLVASGHQYRRPGPTTMIHRFVTPWPLAAAGTLLTLNEERRTERTFFLDREG